MIKLFLKRTKICLFNLWKSSYKTAWVEDFPEKLKKKTIYVIGGKNHPFQVVFSCPKNCNKKIFLNISKQHSKFERWELTEHKNGTISLTPSIYMKALDCGCHYWFKRGHVHWIKSRRWLPLKKSISSYFEGVFKNKNIKSQKDTKS